MLGILTGLAREAEMARRLSPLVLCAASDLARAEHLAQDLVAGGATALISFGIAGGLDPALPSGCLVIGTAVASRSECHACDPGLAVLLASALPEAARGPVWGGDHIVTDAAEKARLRHDTRTLVVDLESAAVARAATAARLPFAVLRAVADPAADGLPPAALVGLDAKGRPAPWPVLRALIRRPGQLSALVRLARQSNRAMRALLGGVQRLADSGALRDVP